MSLMGSVPETAVPKCKRYKKGDGEGSDQG